MGWKFGLCGIPRPHRQPERGWSIKASQPDQADRRIEFAGRDDSAMPSFRFGARPLLRQVLVSINPCRMPEQEIHHLN